MDKIVDLIYNGSSDDWTNRCNVAFDDLYSSQEGRYPDRARKLATLRAPTFSTNTGIVFASLIHPSNPDSGA